MEKNIPNDPHEFNELLLRVDRQLADEGIRIHMRLLHALRVISTEFGIPLPLGPPTAGMVHPTDRYWPISERIRTWYERQYGDRLKVHLGPGRMAFLIENDVWVFRFPRCYGKVKYTASRTAKSISMCANGEPAICNILDSIEKLPEGLRHSLSDSHLRQLLDNFMLGYDGLRQLQTLVGDELVNSAFADIAACVDHISSNSPNYDLAKWSSLQAAEKVLKAGIRKTGAQFPKTHKLSQLVKIARDAGLDLHSDGVIVKLQCSPGIRYGQEPCTLEQAVEAHHAVFELTCDVTKALRKSSL
ncbi:MAG: HEPN domain-containing protein [Deltaproteobacteria bacterium]|nr:HEPN domain-containing protein [Deltaproteobacteria bacterium]